MNKDQEIGWLAGIVDGEGCISLSYHNNNGSYITLHLCVAMTHKNTITRVRRIAGLGIARILDSNSLYKTVYEWRAHGLEAARVISRIKDCLCTKLPQAEIALEFASTTLSDRRRFLSKEIREKRLELYLKMRELNKRERLKEDD